uniref:Uncharacterized protein n=1 Tax=Anguilla anguilla TaxID=7936 RepID=A0A0E9UFZ9_ANGAN
MCVNNRSTCLLFCVVQTSLSSFSPAKQHLLPSFCFQSIGTFTR